MRNEERSGLRCLQELVTKLHLAPDWDSVVDDDLRSLYERDPMAALKQAGEKFEYQPEVHDIRELREYSGSALVLLKNNEYICVVNMSQLAGDKVGLFNPRGEKGPCTVVLPTESLATGKMLTAQALFPLAQALSIKRTLPAGHFSMLLTQKISMVHCAQRSSTRLSP